MTAANTGDGYQKLIDIGIALSAERNHARLMERILVEAKELCNADGGTLYLRTEDDALQFTIMRTDSLKIAMGGTTGKDINFPPLPLYDPDTHEPNEGNIASYAALTKQSVNIPDAYEEEGFDFTGTKKFDEGTGYRSKSFLTVPLSNHEGDVIGVLQLLNAQNADTGEVIAFSSDIQPLIEALASQAAVALDNQMLLAAQKKLFDSFIKVIASAIDAKSPYTGGHCERVPELARMLAEAAHNSDAGPFQDFKLDDDDWDELRVAAWLHDCGKVTTPEYVVDKATKLETIYNRIHEVRTRFEVLKRDAEITYLKAVMDGGDKEALKSDFDAAIAKLDDDYVFVAECNEGGEFMAPDKVDRLKEIAGATWQRTFDDRIGLSHDEMQRIKSAPVPLPATENVLSDKADHVIARDKAPAGAGSGHGFKMDVPENLFNLGEVYNLSIGRGTLTNEERYQINEHIVQTIIMLEQLPFPKNLRRVPDYAGAHHETMIGTGYPRKLEAEDMNIPARIMAIADIFEALTAADRPYKKPKSLSDSVRILSFFKKDMHIDPDLFDLFLTSGVFQEYADKYLLENQLDEVDVGQYVAAAAE